MEKWWRTYRLSHSLQETQREAKRERKKEGSGKGRCQGANHRPPWLSVVCSHSPHHLLLFHTGPWELVLVLNNLAQSCKSRTGETQASPALGHQAARRPSCSFVLP